MIINYGFLWIGLLCTAFAVFFIWMYINRERIGIVSMSRVWCGMIFSGLMGFAFIFMAFFEALLKS